MSAGKKETRDGVNSDVMCQEEGSGSGGVELKRTT